MADAIIRLSDDKDGFLQMTVEFVGGYDPKSHAHGQASLIIKDIDSRAASKCEPDLLEEAPASMLVVD